MPMATHTVPPPLREGDQLTSEEFLLRWNTMPDLKQAELLDGVVYMPSPVGRPHSRIHIIVSGWITAYEAATPGCEGGAEGTWLMSAGNVPQPDITLRILPEHGGQSRVEGIYTVGAPELIIEIAASSRARDLGIKRTLYERMGVREYVVAVAGDSHLYWHVLSERGYELLEPSFGGLFRSTHFPGLWLDPEALWNLDAAGILSALQQGLVTPEHAAFVARLAGSNR